MSRRTGAGRTRRPEGWTVRRLFVAVLSIGAVVLSVGTIGAFAAGGTDAPPAVLT